MNPEWLPRLPSPGCDSIAHAVARRPHPTAELPYADLAMSTLGGAASPRYPRDERCARWLHAILRDDLLSVVFQPIVNLLTGDVVVYEALGRVPVTLEGEPDYAPLGPLDWLDVAQGCGLLLELDRSWRRHAVEEVARSHAGNNTSFALNIDPRILDEPGFGAGYTRDIIERSRLSPSRF